jgi:hypothetical protein
MLRFQVVSSDNRFSMPPIDTVTLAGKSGRTYEFRIYPWKHVFKRLAAVYAVMERVIESRSTPAYSTIYVGETENIRAVFSGHEKRECFEMYYANTIGVLPETDAARRAAIVEDLRAALDPPCNRKSSP